MQGDNNLEVSPKKKGDPMLVSSCSLTKNQDFQELLGPKVF